MNDYSQAMAISRAVFSDLDKHWCEGAGRGMHRPGYSVQETDAIEMVATQARRLGMHTGYDAAGNAHFMYPGADRSAPALMIGSHLDAVPEGGRYDGPAGVVAGLAALRHIHDSGQVPPQDVRLTVFRAEESPWYGMACIGSKFFTGDLRAAFMKSARFKGTDDTLESRMQDCGIDTAALAVKLDTGGALVPLENIGAYLEVHIEQGPALLAAGASIGIVSAIRGHVRYPQGIKFFGQAAHTGSTPQVLRRDAAIAAARFVSRWADAMDAMGGSAGDDLVYAVPDIRVVNPSSTTVAAECFVQPEVRSIDPAILDAARILTAEIAAAAVRTGRGLRHEIGPVVMGKPAMMDKNLRDYFTAEAARLGISAMTLPSGAGHDAGIMANAGVPSAMLFIRHGNEGISHNPREIMTVNEGDDPFAEDGDFCNAVRMLAAAIRQPMTPVP